jgi:late competence protein required for DNA uptake (superfamily II DNA/RNA helicase)
MIISALAAVFAVITGIFYLNAKRNKEYKQKYEDAEKANLHLAHKYDDLMYQKELWEGRAKKNLSRIKWLESVLKEERSKNI